MAGETREVEIAAKIDSYPTALNTQKPFYRRPESYLSLDDTYLARGDEGLDKIKTFKVQGAGALTGKPEGVALNEQQTRFLIREKLTQADNLFFVLPFHIGDAVVSLGYINAIIANLRQVGNTATVNLVVPDSLYNLVAPMEGDKLKVLTGGQKEPRIDINRPNVAPDQPIGGIKTANQTVFTDNNIKKAVVLDFEDITSPVFAVNTTLPDKDATIMRGLFGATFRYGNQLGDNRYSAFANDVFDVPPKNRKVEFTPPILKLPPDANELYTEVAKRFGIDTARPQISVVLESGSAGRQYSTAQWAETVRLIQSKHPGLQVNFIVNPFKEADNPTLVDTTRLMNEISQAGLTDAKVVHGKLSELTSLFAKQELILSDDGGIFHVASAIENGPKTIGLFFAGFANHWVSNPQKSIALETPPDGRAWQQEWGNTNDATKWINKIAPQQIADKADAALKRDDINTPMANTEQMPETDKGRL